MHMNESIPLILDRNARALYHAHINKQDTVIDMTFIFSWDDGKGPWGKKAPKSASQQPNPRRAEGPKSADQAEIEDMIRSAQEKFKRFSGGYGGNKGSGGGAPINTSGGMFIGVVVAVLAVVWLLSGFYVVAPDEEGVVLRFGKYQQTTVSGLNYHLPSPIEEVIKPQVTRENIIEVGYRSNNRQRGVFDNPSIVRQAAFSSESAMGDNTNIRDIAAESLMLTGDENIVDLDFTVRWRIADSRDYLFNVANVPETIKNVAESVMREVIGRRPIDDALTENKSLIQQAAKQELQAVLDTYRAGVQISSVELQQVNPPTAVIDAFRDVQAARADEERAVNEAIGYKNDVLPRARGQAAQILQEAEGYKEATVAKARGAADRFEAQLKEYVKAPAVTSKRLYLETMEKVLKDNQKVIVGGEAGKNMVPYLPLNELTKKGSQ